MLQKDHFPLGTNKDLSICKSAGENFTNIQEEANAVKFTDRREGFRDETPTIE